MKSAQLQELTASEPLSLEEEFEMQQKWATDDDKLTFIVECLDFISPHDRCKGLEGGMVGDVNVFYSVNEDNAVDYSRGEIEVMIAEESVRRRGVAKEAVELMMRYAHDNLGTSKFEAKILEHNEGSIKLFTEKLGFEFVKRNLVFKEIVLVKRFR